MSGYPGVIGSYNYCTKLSELNSYLFSPHRQAIFGPKPKSALCESCTKPSRNELSIREGYINDL